MEAAARPAPDAAFLALAGARDLAARARIITLSWDGAQVGRIAAQQGCHSPTVYRWLHRCNQGGIDDLGDLPRSGRP